MIRLAAAVACIAALTACAPPDEDAVSKAPAGSSTVAGLGVVTSGDFKTALPLKDVMAHVINFNAFEVWHRQGWLINEEGEHSYFPTNDEEWGDAESAAMALAEASNLLLLPGRPRDEEGRRWIDYAHKLYDAGMTAASAAQKKDNQAFFDAGGTIYEACLTCHNHFVLGDAPGPDAKLPPLPNRESPN